MRVGDRVVSRHNWHLGEKGIIIKVKNGAGLYEVLFDTRDNPYIYAEYYLRLVKRTKSKYPKPWSK